MNRIYIFISLSFLVIVGLTIFYKKGTDRKPTVIYEKPSETQILSYLSAQTGFGYGVEYFSGIEETGDLNDDGYNETFAEAYGAGGSCVGGTGYKILYSPKNQEYFIGASSILEKLPSGNPEKVYCTILDSHHYWEDCGYYLRYNCFSTNLKDDKNKAYRVYLETRLTNPVVSSPGYFTVPKSLPTMQPSVASLSLPPTCVDQQEGISVITSLSSYSGPVGTKLEIVGCNFSGFEGDNNAWIENDRGAKGLLYGESGSTNKLLKVTLKSPLCQKDISYSGLPCDAWFTLTPGIYKIYTTPWGKKSNEATFTIR